MIRPSSFNLFLPPSTPYKLRIFNTATRKSIALKHSWETLLAAALIDNELKTYLLNQGFLTHAEDYYQECINILDLLDKPTSGTLTICYTITLDCSLHCPYCFQQGQQNPGIDNSVINSFLELLDKELNRPDQSYKSIDLILFGGDPMLEHQNACTLLDGLRRISSQHQCKLEVLMTTNGVIRDNLIFQQLAKRGVNSVMLSFDGNREIHDRTRNNTFTTIMANLPLLSSHFFLVIKYNLHLQSIKEAVYLDFLRTILQTLKPGQFVIAFEALHPTGHENLELVGYLERSPMLAEQILRLHRLTIEHGVQSNINNSLHPPCPGLQRNTILMLPNGELLFCNAAIGKPNFSLGTIQNSNTLFASKSSQREIITKALQGKCKEEQCALFPLCQTGCLFEKHIKDIPLSDTVCHKDYIEALLPHLFTQPS